MRWTKLKQMVESSFCEGVKGHVGLWTTRYTKGHDRQGRSWITLDGVEILNMSNFLPIGKDIADGHPDRFQKGIFAGYDLPDAMKLFIDMPVQDALISSNPLIRGLAVLDHRVGIRTLAKIDEKQEPSIVVKLILIRRSLTTVK